MRRSFVLLDAVVFGIGGFALGWATTARSDATPAIQPTTAAPARAPVDAPDPVQRALICAQRSSPASADPTENCAASELRTRWCEGQLSECERTREAVRRPWPADDTVESPDRWTEAIEDGLAECEIEGAELELVDCTEYPCVAALRPDVDGGPDSEAFRAAQTRLIEEVRACAPLRQAFGVTDDASSKALDVFANDTTCPDGTRVDFLALMALHPEGPAFDLIDQSDAKRSKRQERDLFRWLFRRGDDIAAQYPCD